MRQENDDLGFGNFSTAETENDWLRRPYDGFESGADLERILRHKGLEIEDLEKMQK